MVEVICEKSGLKFEATSKRTKNHPGIMYIVNEAYKDGWYDSALQTIKKGKDEGLQTIEEFKARLEQTHMAIKNAEAERVHALAVKKFNEERAKEDARRKRLAQNEFLRENGYTWSDLGYAPDEEVDNSYMGPTPRHDWHLFGPDGHEVSTQQAMRQLAKQNLSFAKEWLAERNLLEIVDEVVVDDSHKETVDEYLKRVASETPEERITRQTHEVGDSWAALSWCMEYPSQKEEEEIRKDAEIKSVEFFSTDLFQASLVNCPDIPIEPLHVLFVETYTKHYKGKVQGVETKN